MWIWKSENPTVGVADFEKSAFRTVVLKFEIRTFNANFAAAYSARHLQIRAFKI